MTREEFQELCIVRRLNIGDTISVFDCNDEDLNDFLLNDANLYRSALLSVTYVVEDKQTNVIFHSIIEYPNIWNTPNQHIEQTDKDY